MNALRAWFLVCVVVAGCGPADVDQPGGITKISYWRTLTGAAGDAQDELVERFNASQDEIEVTVQFQGSYGDLAAKLMTAAASDSAPSVAHLGTFEIRQFARAGILVDLRPLADTSETLELSTWPGSIADAGRVDGGLYWLPFNVTVPILYYNSDAFAEAGVKAPPSTWDEFFLVVERVTKRNESGRVTRPGLALWNITWPWISAIWSEGGELTNRDYSDITLDDPAAVSVFTKLQTLVRSGAAILPDQASGGHRAAFISGRAAMILDSPAPSDDIFKAATTFRPDIASYPQGGAGRIYAPGGGGLVILKSATARQQGAAWTFVQFMLAPEQIAYFAQRSGYADFRAVEDEPPSDETRRRVVRESLPHLRGDFSVTMSPALRNAFDEAFQKIVSQLADVEETLKLADAQAEREITRER